MPNWNQRKDRVPTDVITDRPDFDVLVPPEREAAILAYCQTYAIVERPHLSVRRGDPLRILAQHAEGVSTLIMRAYCRAVVDLMLTTSKILVANTHLPPIAAQVFHEALGYPTRDAFYARFNPDYAGYTATIVHWA